ncbi:MAG: methyltransferase domain-containing protein [Solirubrobacterales bacterium]
MAPLDPPAAERVLTEPVVASTAYDEDYYLHRCFGSDEWRESDGQTPDPLYGGMLDLIGLQPDTRVLDVGTGRGELPRVAVERGASEAMGIDYSHAAIELARKVAADRGLSHVTYRQADARAIPAADGHYDLVTMLDVVEHLSPRELRDTLGEVRRVLAPGGQLFVHTAPNRLVYDVTYCIQRMVAPWRLWRWPADPRNEHERTMHVNEQTQGSLGKALRTAGFDPVEVWLGWWIYTGFVPSTRAGRTYHRLARLGRGLDRFGVADLYARARAPAATGSPAPSDRG